MHRVVLGTLAASALVLTGCSSGQDSPEDLGDTLETVMNNQEFDIFADLTCAADKKKVDKYDFEKQMAAKGIKQVEYTVEFVEAAPAKKNQSDLTFTITWDNMPEQLKQASGKDSQRQKIPAKQEGGKWVVCSK